MDINNHKRLHLFSAHLEQINILILNCAFVKKMSNLELSVPYEDQVLNIDGNPITLEDILEDTSLYINSSLFPTPKDSGT